MPDPEIFTGPDGRKYYRLRNMDPVPVDEVHPETSASSSMGGKALAFLKNTSPELVAGLSDALAPETMGLSSLVAPLAAAGTDALRQYGDTGKVDWGSVAMRGATNVVPDVAGRVTKAAADVGDMGAHVAMGAMTGGPKGGILAGLKSMLFGEAAPAATAAAGGADELAKMTLPGGIRVLSSDGLKELVRKSVDLANAKGTPPAQIQAIDALIDRVRTALKPTNLTAADLLSKVGMPTSTSDAIAAAAQKALRTARATRAGQYVKHGLRGALGLAQGTLAAGEEP